MIETELWNETFMHVYLGLLSLNSKLSPYFLQILIFFSIIYCLNLLICLLLICCLIFTVLITIKCIYWREGLVKTEMERKPTVRNGRGCLEKAMATHPSTLAWQIPWTEEPGRLQSTESLEVRQDWATSLSLFTFMHWRRKWQPTPVFLPEEFRGPGSLVGCRLLGRTESDTTEAT